MTRTDLLNKKVDKLNNTSEIHAALMKRAKEANGGTTLELVIAGMQNVVNA